MDDQPIKQSEWSHRDSMPESVSVSRSRRRTIYWSVAGLLIAAALAWYFWPHSKTQTAGSPGQTAPRGRGGPGGRFGAGGPMPVVTEAVSTGSMPITLNALGTVTPLANVTVRTQIAGQLQQVAFKEGQYVTKGQFLAQIDPRPYQIQLEQGRAQLAHDEALLKNARLDLKRYTTLAAEDSIAGQQVDTQASLVRQYEGTIKADHATIHTAQLNLIYCHIVAPVTGRVGLRQVDAGNYVQTSDTNGIVIITQTKPISVIFTIAEDNLPAVLKQVHGGAMLPVTAMDRSQTTKLATGSLATLDNQIDTTTGMVKLRSDFANADENLFPNQFVNAQLLVETLQNVTIVPSAAIQRGAPGTYVYIVNPNHKVAVRKIVLGPTDGQRTVVQSGLKPGELIVTDGTDRLKDGADVIVQGAKKTAEVGANGTSAAGTAPADDGSSTGTTHRHRHHAQADGQSDGQPPSGQTSNGQMPDGQESDGQAGTAPAPTGGSPNNANPGGGTH